MGLDGLMRLWSGSGLRHIPAHSSRSVLDETYAGVARLNRWNEAGTPTFYFACDIGVVIAEYARHIAGELPEGEAERQVRDVWKVAITIERMIDLTDPATSAALSLPPIGEWIGDVARTQATSRFLRQHADVQGLRVPSVAFPDKHGKWNAVIYLDRVDARTAFGEPRFVRQFALEAVGHS
ncbi:MAG: RES family NAD+ phosphorylase [Chloroflexi bacterium]|nr:RES family NAD+ phosphorylase [Chloroflexota bacterium]